MINDQAMNILLLWCFFLTMNIFVVIMINFQAVNNFVAIVVFSSYDYFCCYYDRCSSYECLCCYRGFINLNVFVVRVVSYVMV